MTSVLRHICYKCSQITDVTLRLRPSALNRPNAFICASSRVFVSGGKAGSVAGNRELAQSSNHASSRLYCCSVVERTKGVFNRPPKEDCLTQTTMILPLPIHHPVVG